MKTSPAHRDSAECAQPESSMNSNACICSVVCVPSTQAADAEVPSYYNRESLLSLMRLLGIKLRWGRSLVAQTFDVIESSRDGQTRQGAKYTWTRRPDLTYQVTVPRDEFFEIVIEQAKQQCPLQLEDVNLAASLQEGTRCVVILLCGTSGCGKSTLASLLGQNLGISTVLSTDSIRHMLRGFTTKAADPILFASTYHAGDALDPNDTSIASLSPAQLVIKGYKAQCGPVLAQLDALLAGWGARNQSAIVEGVHLGLKSVAKLMQRYPFIVPFLVYIKKAHTHAERMAVRAKNMSSDPDKNKYVKYMGNIRSIQDYHVQNADKLRIPKVQNSNVDRSIDIIHSTVLGALKRLNKGDALFDPVTRTAKAVMSEFELATAQQSSLQRNVKAIRKGVQHLYTHGSSRTPDQDSLLTALTGKSESRLYIPNDNEVEPQSDARPHSGLSRSTSSDAAALLHPAGADGMLFVDSATHASGTSDAARRANTPGSSTNVSRGGERSSDIGQAAAENAVPAPQPPTSQPATDQTNPDSHHDLVSAAPDSVTVQHVTADEMVAGEPTLDGQPGGGQAPAGTGSMINSADEHVEAQAEDESDDDYMPTLDSAFSITEVGSLCDSTDLDDEEMLEALWDHLCEEHGNFHSVAEPHRSAVLCSALLDYMRVNSPSIPLHLDATLSPTSSTTSLQALGSKSSMPSSSQRVRFRQFSVPERRRRQRSGSRDEFRRLSSNSFHPPGSDSNECLPPRTGSFSPRIPADSPVSPHYLYPHSQQLDDPAAGMEAFRITGSGTHEPSHHGASPGAGALHTQPPHRHALALPELPHHDVAPSYPLSATTRSLDTTLSHSTPACFSRLAEGLRAAADTPSAGQTAIVSLQSKLQDMSTASDVLAAPVFDAGEGSGDEEASDVFPDAGTALNLRHGLHDQASSRRGFLAPHRSSLHAINNSMARGVWLPNNSRDAVVTLEILVSRIIRSNSTSSLPQAAATQASNGPQSSVSFRE